MTYRSDEALSAGRSSWWIPVFIVVSFLPAIIGSQFMPDDWFRSLNKPSFNPPGWVFAPVWTVLYALMGLSSWLFWRKASGLRLKTGLGLFTVQLALNAAWTWLFFGLHQPAWALVDICVLWVLIVATGVVFLSRSMVAGALLLPYLLWVSFATALNYAFMLLNP